jgi:transcriptional regulator with XRE-family HTH domain
MNLRVKEICREKGLLMENLAKKLGITPNTLTRNINGNPTKDTLEKIAAELNVSIVDLFEQPKSDTINCPHCGGAIKVGKG